MNIAPTLRDANDATPRRKLEPQDWTQRERVPRKRLLERLTQAEDKRLVAITGPAGSGKSILLAQHFAARSETGAAIGWITLDHADADPALLLNGFIRALEPVLGAAPDAICGDALAAAAADPTRAVRRLLDWPKLADATCTLIIDGYELIAAAPSNALLDAWIRADASRLIIASRVAIEAPLALLRAQGDVETIGARDLALDIAELMALAGDQMSPIYIDRLMRETGGAPVVVCHALDALRRPLIGSAPANARSWRGMLQDYYTEQLREDLSPELWHALVRLAAVEFFDIPLASELIGAPAARIVQKLYRERGLVIRDGASAAYHVEPGLRAALHAELEWLDEAELRRLHARAAGWFARRGHVPYAAMHAIAADDPTLAASCMAKAGSAAFAARVGVRELRLNLSILSDGADDAILTQTRALTKAQESPGKCGELIIPETRASHADPEMVLIDAFINAYADIAPVPDRLRICRDLATTDDASDLAPRGLARCFLCWEALRGARLDEAMGWALLSRDDLEFADAAYAGVFVHLHAINICLQLDDLDQARAHADEAEQITKLFFPDDPRLLNLVWLNAAWIQSEQGALLRTEDLSACFAATCAGEGWMEALWISTVLASRQALRRGDVVGAARMLERGLGEAVSRDAARIVWALRCERVRLLTALGDLDAAAADARRLGLDDTGLDPLNTPSLTWREVTDGWINAAHLCLATDELTKAESLARALAAFAESHRLPRLIAISRQLHDMLAGGRCADDDAGAEHDACAEDASKALADRRVSLLTPREHELMNLVAKGLVNKQIAYELGVTETTIKFHMRNIYKKLRARNRVQALMRMSAGAPI